MFQTVIRQSDVKGRPYQVGGGKFRLPGQEGLFTAELRPETEFGAKIAPGLTPQDVPVFMSIQEEVSTPSILSTDSVRNEFAEGKDKVDKLETPFAASVPEGVREGDFVSGKGILTPEGTFRPVEEGAISFKSDNPAFQAVIDQANKLISDTQAKGAELTPDITGSIDAINNFELSRTQAVADARTAADNKDAEGLKTALDEEDQAKTEIDSEVQKLLDNLAKTRADYAASFAPTTRETDLRRELQALRDERQLMPLELRKEGISAAGIAGRQVEDERVRAIQEGNLLFELGLEQEARQFKTESLDKQIGFITKDIEIQQKIEEKLAAEEKRIADEARNLRKDSLTALNDIVSSFEGLAFEDMDAATQADVLAKAKEFDIPPSLLIAALKNAKQQKVFDNMIKASRENRLTEESKEFGKATPAQQAQAKNWLVLQPSFTEEDLEKLESDPIFFAWVLKQAESE